ncbi:MAG: dephospho-CoA kinase [Gammaproteobacteria bacterium]|nr:dephospho-CoA kinase [Gammaproteobacteria bacterium]
MPKLTVGLTGGLASGKSTVLGLFDKLGVETLSADKIVHSLIENSGLAYSTIIDHFGPGILTSEKNIDRSKLRHIIFSSSEEKRWLEQYLHPLVRSSLLKQLEKVTSPYAVIEIPLLAESETPFEWLDRVLVVDTDEETQQLRAQLRSGLTQQESRNILDQQANRQKRNSIADDVIINQGSLFELEIQVNELHNQYLKLADFTLGK